MPFSQSSLDKALFDILTDAVIAVSPARTIMKYNKAAEKLFGVSKEECCGKPLSHWFLQDNSVDDLFRVGQPIDPEIDLTFIVIAPRNAPAFLGHVSVAPVTDSGGSFMAVLFVIRNVTSYHEAISRLTRENETTKLQAAQQCAIFDKLPALVVSHDQNDIIQYASDDYCDFVGLPRSDIIGRHGYDFVAPEHHGALRALYASATEEKPIVVYENPITNKDGSTSLQLWSISIRFRDGVADGAICLGYDITEFQEKHNSIAAQSAELQRKNEALGQFAAIVSHDLKAPLRHIAMFADMMNDDIANQKYDELSLYAHHVRNSAIRMDRIIKSLLQYSQIAYRIISRSNFDAASVVISAIQNLETLVEEAKAEILVGKLPIMNGDAELMRHLIQNLISNAVKYRRPGIKPKVRISAMETAEEISLIVEDNGIGIDPKHAQKIFGPFQRLHKDEKTYEGFGIGLALCKQIAESHDGSIELDTSYTDGSRFVVHLPKSDTTGASR